MANASRDENNVPTLLAASNADGVTPVRVYADPTTHRLLVSTTGGTGTVTSVSVVSANGFAGTVATATTTPAITLSTTLNTPVTAGNGTALIAATTSGTGSTVILQGSPTLTTPNLGTPSTLVGTNITGTAAGLTAGNVTTNANLTGVITSVGNATSIASQTGTGTKFVVDTSPTLVTPVLGVATGTSIALGGATIGTDKLAITGTATISGTANFSASIVVQGNIAGSGNVIGGSGSVLGWSTKSFMDSPSNGIIRLTNQAQTDFTRLQFGGTTTSFPAIGRTGTTLFVQLADGTAGGSLGVGTNTPIFPLSIVAADAATAVSIVGAGSSSGSGSALEFNYGGAAATLSSTRIARILANTQSGGGGDIFFQTASSGSAAYATVMNLTRAGLLGIGVTPITTLDVAGGMGGQLVSKTANYTATAADFTILCDATSGAITITLPAASGATRRIYNVKKTDASVNSVTIDANASETIDGALTKVLATQYSSATIQCDGSNWWII